MAITGGSYAGAAAASNDIATQLRVIQGWMNQASAVYSEGSGVTNHAIRATFATKVLTGQINVNSLVQSCTAQGITAASTDANIDSTIDAIYNALAGA